MFVVAGVVLVGAFDDFVDVVVVDAGFFAGAGVFDGAVAADHFDEVGVVAAFGDLAFGPGAVVGFVAGHLLAVGFFVSGGLLLLLFLEVGVVGGEALGVLLRLGVEHFSALLLHDLGVFLQGLFHGLHGGGVGFEGGFGAVELDDPHRPGVGTDWISRYVGDGAIVDGAAFEGAGHGVADALGLGVGEHSFLLGVGEDLVDGDGGLAAGLIDLADLRGEGGEGFEGFEIRGDENRGRGGGLDVKPFGAGFVLAVHLHDHGVGGADGEACADDDVLVGGAFDDDGVEAGLGAAFPAGGDADAAGAVGEFVGGELDIGGGVGGGRGGGELVPLGRGSVGFGVDDGDGRALIGGFAGDEAFDGLALQFCGEGCAAGVVGFGVFERAGDGGLGVEVLGEVGEGGFEGGLDCCRFGLLGGEGFAGVGGVDEGVAGEGSGVGGGGWIGVVGEGIGGGGGGQWVCEGVGGEFFEGVGGVVGGEGEAGGFGGGGEGVGVALAGESAEEFAGFFVGGDGEVLLAHGDLAGVGGGFGFELEGDLGAFVFAGVVGGGVSGRRDEETEGDQGKGAKWHLGSRSFGKVEQNCSCFRNDWKFQSALLNDCCAGVPTLLGGLMVRHLIYVGLIVLLGVGRVLGVESSPVEEKCRGTWEMAVPNPQGGSTWTFLVKADGTYDFSAVGNGAPGGHHGTFAAMDGKWALQAVNIPWKDGGTYEMADENTFVMNGVLGKGVWKRRGKAAADVPTLVPVPSGVKEPVKPVVAGGPPPLDVLDVPVKTAGGVVEFIDGLDALSRMKCEDAVAALGKAIDANEEAGEYYTARGVAYLMEEKIAEGQKDLERAVRLDPQAKDPKRMLSFAVRMKGDEAGAARFYSHGSTDSYDQFLVKTGNNYGKLAIAQRMNNPQFLQECRQNRAAALRDFHNIAEAFAQSHRQGEVVGKALFGRGIARVGKKDYAGAQADLASVLAVYPEDRTTLYYHAMSLLGLGNAEGARREFTLVLSWKSALVEGYVGRAAAAVALGDVKRAEGDLAVAQKLDEKNSRGIRGDVEKSLAELKKQPALPLPQELMTALLVSARDKAGWDVLVKQATELVRVANAVRLRGDERYQDRRRALEWAVAANPKNADVLAALGNFILAEVDVHGECVEPNGDWTYYRAQTGDQKQAELNLAGQMFAAALQADPRHVKSMIGQAAMKIRDGLWGDAENILRGAMQIKDNDPEMLELMARIMQEAANQRYSGASDLRTVRTWTEFGYDCTWFCTRYPSLAERDRADQLESAGNNFMKFSQQYVAKAIAAMGNTADGYYYQGLVATGGGDFERARQALEAAVKLDPNHLRARSSLSNVYAKLNMPVEAVLEQTKAKNLEQTSCAPYLQRAWSKIVNTAWKSARESLLAANIWDAADARIPAYLGVIGEGNNQPDEAIACFRAAMAIEEAKANARGNTLQGSAGGLGSIKEFGLSMALRLKMANYVKQDAGESLKLYLANVSMEQRIPEWGWTGKLPSAMLPDPTANLNVVPSPPMIVVLMMKSRLAAGRALLAINKPNDAIVQFQSMLGYPGKMHQGGMIYTDDYVDWAKLGMCDCYVHLGDKTQAQQWNMQVRGRDFGDPIEIERMRLKQETGQRLRGPG